ncbi:DUF1214 domain-containing protein [Rhizobium ruizarguesonis]|uniref:DUF1214 domain-containing protein n=1 Tax=Rhizobium ruizarguesonis TaxID=2081791 RepID=UPI001FDF2C19|nr:DUF1214 domain-containing protein [Rhizobium ruizarguesonis]
MTTSWRFPLFVALLMATLAVPSRPIFAEDVASKPITVTVGNFIRAETDTYFRSTVKDGGFGKLKHRHDMASIDKQDVVRMNRDTLYSSGVFDLDAGPVAITLPDAGKRFMSMQVISEDHYTVDVVYDPGPHSYSRNTVGTRYAFVIVRTLADSRSSEDMKLANALQDAIRVAQATTGTFEVPDWEPKSQAKVRDALAVLGSLHGDDKAQMFGSKAEVDPVAHLIGTSIGWGGNPPSAAIYQSVYPKSNDGRTVYRLTVKDVPVDGFWSISVYNGKGFFEKNKIGAYSLNSLTAKPSSDGSFTIQFGACEKPSPNCLPIMRDWNYTVRMYRPHAAILRGEWTFPEAKPIK